MLRLSRALTLFIAIVVWCTMFAFSIWLFILNHRLSRELVSHAWRTPTTIVSNAHARRDVVARLYGTDWRVMPLVTIDSLPRHVPNAFLAAEDVRFHHHFGIDPIGIARALLRDVRAHGVVEGASTID